MQKEYEQEVTEWISKQAKDTANNICNNRSAKSTVSKSGYDVWRDNNLFFDKMEVYRRDVYQGAPLDAYTDDFMQAVLEWDKWRKEHIK